MMLRSRIGGVLSREVDPAVSSFAERLAQESAALGVLFYGSNLRTGLREGVLDFYVLADGAAEKGLWPTVSYREWDHEGEVLRAKIATMTLAKFSKAARGETIDTTIWTRFVQPSALVWCRNDAAQLQISAAIEAAAITAARLAVAVGPEAGVEEDYWRALFRNTYRAEFRVEKPGREDSILSLNPDHFSGLLPDALAAGSIPYGREGEILTPRITVAQRADILSWWEKRRRMGKPLNIARLARATRTFDGAARYAAWKVERHTGQAIEVTPFREKHPILSAPSVAFQLWRARRKGRD
ncbi:hypothetical protein [Aurantiacibacter rhizosphaerae]|uniref:Uncharacterized protein n=1 Tax=Aurantiacibacter rhizosphaerae TaxID=2691582 RepID=A0A844X9J6_9SPHN|nr:hypothetical protein [Aurantiacibacter rhizosphaerae]MWV26459.1 hypothetical protein [Aurantiacibacter rhizosphaerae]